MDAQIVSTDDHSFTIQVTVSYQDNMLQAEEALQEGLNKVGSLSTLELLAYFDTDGSPIRIGETNLTSKGKVEKEYQTGLMKIGGLRTFFLPVNLRVFVPFWVLGKDRSVLLACFLHAILGYPLIPLIKTVHSHGRRSALYQPTP